MEYYRLILYVIFGAIPSLAWLFYYLAKDLHPEPKKMILKVFLYGVAVTVPVFLLQLGLNGLLKNLQETSIFIYFPILVGLVKWFIVIAFVEETLKYMVVRLTVFNSRELDEPLDIMLYMVVVALGFAALENILYLFSPIDNLSFDVVLKTAVTISFIRFVGATFLHTLCSALLGYFLALSSIKNGHGVKLTLLGIVLATLLHGLYNFSIMTLSTPLNFLIPIIIVVGLTVFMLYDFDSIKKVKSICKI